MGWHKSKPDKTRAGLVLAGDDYKMVLIENFPCNDKYELGARERYWIESLICVNKNIPTRTHKEWLNDNREAVVAYQAEYSKQYRDSNADKLRAYSVDYYDSHKEQLKTYAREYYADNKVEIHKIVVCECGVEITRASLLRHTKTKKHLGKINDHIGGSTI